MATTQETTDPERDLACEQLHWFLELIDGTRKNKFAQAARAIEELTRLGIDVRYRRRRAMEAQTLR